MAAKGDVGLRVTETLALLAERGMRRTAARQAILEALFAAGGHVTADDLASLVQKRFPSVDVSTVYRTIDVLEELGVVDHVHLAHSPAVYHLAEDDHQHLVCEHCGRIEELPAERLRPFLRMLKGEFGFEVPRRHFAIVGICASCTES